jgi:hypothetical protein
MSTLRSATLKLAASLPKGDPTRRKLLAAAKAADGRFDPLVPGDIMYSSWGYDQTNIDFYQVIKATPKQVIIQQLEKKVVKDHRASEDVVPLPGRFKPGGKKLRRKVQDYGSSPSVNLNSYAGAYLWDGKPKNQTSAGYGH